MKAIKNWGEVMTKNYRCSNKDCKSVSKDYPEKTAKLESTKDGWGHFHNSDVSLCIICMMKRQENPLKLIHTSGLKSGMKYVKNV